MDALKKRQKKVLDWVKNHQGSVILLIAGILLAIRLYYFFLTVNQPVWWDEGDYLNIARWWAFGSPQWDVDPLRPLLFPFLVAGLFKIGLSSEFFIRLIPFLSSIISVVLVYFIGKDLYDKKVGLTSAFMLTVFWSFLFFSFRMLVDVPVAMLWLLSLFLFIRGYEHGQKKCLWLCIPVMVLAFLMKFTGALLAPILVVYLFIVYRLKPLKDKNLWISIGLGVLTVLPFLWYQFSRFGHPLAFYVKAIGGRAPSPRSMWQTFIDYIKVTFPHIETAFLILFIIGFIILLFELIIGFDLLWKKRDKNLKANLLLLLTFLVPFLYIVSLGYGRYIEERYLFIMYPFMFIIAAKGLFDLSKYIRKHSKVMATLVIIAFLAVGFYQNVEHGDKLIRSKENSFGQVKESAIWVRDHSDPDDLIFVHHTQAEFQYASNRKVQGIPGADATELIKEIVEKKPKFVVLNVFARVGEADAWKIAFPYVNTDIFKPEISYKPFIDDKQQIPIVTVFSIKPEFYEGKK
tara:strand:- start:12861 stop:14411 length:1551 start_codon:yes stop_codon:yes gene_type:complete